MAKLGGIVLYVEDEESDRFLMQRAFANVGSERVLRTVNDGKAAVDYLTSSAEYNDRKTHPLPTLVLLDLNLPQVNGFDVLKWIRAHPAHTSLPVVVFTSSEREEDRTRARALGATDFVKKPN